ncbi:hypothetical protein CCO03_01915 [Comamonas serinivorans]|uniref:Uncharacterized protein n=1 Tax=Comamonas serinivorans TaxID=1082851 RepID=A0A1Y0EJ48_9BURK|nr:DUF6622 family protein [Comamonas serinivorans]ARU03606.1 hypothetical protein CCO03_01915 [Comamonas serinivorans]
MTPTTVLTHTPAWVFAVLAALLWLGARQAVPHRLRWRRVVALAAVFTALSALGVVRKLGAGVVGDWAALVWALGWLASSVWVARRALPAGVRFDPRARAFVMPGSPWPLVAMLGVFGLNFALAAGAAVHAGWLQSLPVALLLAASLGAFSGWWVGRAWALSRQMQQARHAVGRGQPAI